MTTYRTQYRPTYNAHGQHDGINPHRQYPVVLDSRHPGKVAQLTMAMIVLMLACGFAWAVVAYGMQIKAILF